MEVRVERVAAPETFALRQRVLRPHQTVEDMALAGDDAPEAGHFLARAGDGAVVATATVRREPLPWDPEHPRAWRLRGMATAEGHRNAGNPWIDEHARVLGVEVVGHVEGHGGGLLWCSARLPAVGFYTRAGLAVRGEPWEEDPIGPHVAMWREVRSRPSTMPGVASRISRPDVAHVAHLARLELTAEELERFTEQLAAVLDHAADVASLDTSDVAPTAHPLPLGNVFREDEPRPALDREEVLAQAPEVEDGRFRVPRILEAP